MSRSTSVSEAKCAPTRRGNLVAGVANIRSCIAACRRRLLESVLSRSETLQEACQALSFDTSIAANAFRAAYLCDFQSCGVQYRGRRGQDPNVNWPIGTCSTLGRHSLVDPGPPPTTSSCESTPANEKDPCPCNRRQSTISSKPDGPYYPNLFRRLLGQVVNKNTPGMARLQPASASNSTASSTSPSLTELAGIAIQDPSLSASLHPQDVIIASNRASRDGGLSTGAKITIALSAALVFFVLATLTLIWYLRLRRQTRRARIHGDSSSSKDDQSRVGAHDSPMPLLSPTPNSSNLSGSPLKPPARLRDRRLLSARGNWPLNDMDQLPHRETANDEVGRISTKTRHKARPVSLKVIARTPTLTMSRGSITAGTVTSAEGMIASPPWTPRTPGQQTQLDLLSIASPGPPPNRVLPSTPTGRSPPVPPSTRPRREEIGVAIGSFSEMPGGSRELLLELTEGHEEHALEAHRSWGTWSGRSGRGSAGHASVPVSPSKRTRELSSPVMEEGELERLGGSYK